MVFTCKYCGKKFATKSRHKRIFCCERCKDLYHYNYQLAKIPQGKACVHNKGVCCEKHDHCDVCGWNPDVSLARFREATARGAV